MASLESLDLDQLFDQIAQLGEVGQQMPVWGWAMVTLLLVVLLGSLRKGRIRRAAQSRSTGASGPRRPKGSKGSHRPGDSRGPGRQRDDLPQPGRYGPTATRDLTMDEIERLQPNYAPAPNGYPDPGEIIWTWVPFAEGNGEGKDRPVLIIARVDARSFAACYLTTKPHPGFVSIGQGAWDRSGRESFISPDRVLCVNNLGVRREGQTVPRASFDKAIAGIAARQKQLRAAGPHERPLLR